MPAANVRKVIYEGRIAGVSHGHFKFRPDRLIGLNLVVVPEPENEYDSKAIKLMHIQGGFARKVGYVPRRETDRIHNVLEDGRTMGRLRAVVTRMEVDDGATYQWAVVTITTMVKAPPPPRPPLRPAGSRRLILT